MITTTIVNESEYRRRVYDFFQSILNGRLMSIDANSANDHTIASFVTGYNENESFDNNGCSWLEIGNVEQSNYNGHDYKFINLIPAIGDAIQINFSQFIYPMSRYRREADKLPSFNRNEATCRCTVDGNAISPGTFFGAHKGERLLYLRSFYGVTAFDSIKRVFRFAFNHISTLEIRRHLLLSQIAVLKKYLSNPSVECLGATLKTVNNDNSYVGYDDCLIGSITIDVTTSIFRNEFEHQFLDKLNRLERSCRQ